MLAWGCRRGDEQAVTVVPSDPRPEVVEVPADPFGASNPAYEKLREVTDAALAMRWSGSLDDFAPWLEEQTSSVERALGLLKALRVGPLDVYAVANARIAMVYEHIAIALAEASHIAKAEGFDASWRDRDTLIWERAQSFWARCVRSCRLGGTHLDAWDLRCRAGLADTELHLAPAPTR